MTTKNEAKRELTKAEIEAFAAGANASQADVGHTLKSNPYPAKSDEAAAWEAGFKSVKAEK